MKKLLSILTLLMTFSICVYSQVIEFDGKFIQDGILISAPPYLDKFGNPLIVLRVYSIGVKIEDLFVDYDGLVEGVEKNDTYIEVRLLNRKGHVDIKSNGSGIVSIPIDVENKISAGIAYRITIVKSATSDSCTHQNLRYINIGPMHNIVCRDCKQYIDAENHKFSTSDSCICGAKKTFNTPMESFVETVNGVSFKMIFVEGGAAELVVDFGVNRPVTLSDYHIGETEVTQSLWEAVMNDNPSAYKLGGDHPVENVSWDDCQKFIIKLNSITGKQYRLPSEEQWVYAAKGGKNKKNYPYSGSKNIDKVAWYYGNCQKIFKQHQSVKTKKPNSLGLYDMSGNVYEWCQDLDGFYPPNPSFDSPRDHSIDPENDVILAGFDNSIPAGNHSIRVYRGGCWYSSCEVWHYQRAISAIHFSGVGLRLCLVP